MKYALLSDIHANPAALKTVLSDARAQGAEKILCLGDLTGYGYDAASVVQRIRAVADVCLLGNHDDACADVGYQDERVHTNPNYDLDVSCRKDISTDDLNWLQTRPLIKSFDHFAIAHGTFVNPTAWGYVKYEWDILENFHERPEDSLLFVGHTHLSAIHTLNPDGAVVRVPDLTKTESGISFPILKEYRYLVNVGTVGYPRHDFHSTYALYDDNSQMVELRRLPFDRDAYMHQLETHGIPVYSWCKLAAKADSVDRHFHSPIG